MPCVLTRTYDDGLTCVAYRCRQLHLGLFRSDYLIHEDLETQELGLKQVEFNTISSSFGPLAGQTSAMHRCGWYFNNTRALYLNRHNRYLLAATEYYHASPILSLENMPTNESLTVLAEGMVEAHRAYGKEGFVCCSVYHTLSLNLTLVLTFSSSSKTESVTYSINVGSNTSCSKSKSLQSLIHTPQPVSAGSPLCMLAASWQYGCLPFCSRLPFCSHF